MDQWARETKGGPWGVTINDIDRHLTPEEKMNTNMLPIGSEVYQLSGLTSAGAGSSAPPLVFNNITYYPGDRNHWKTGVVGL